MLGYTLLKLTIVNTEHIIMGKKLNEVEKEAMELPPTDRARLAERLLETLDESEDADVEEQWLQEAEQRYRDYRAGKIGSTPADKVFEEARNKLK